MLRYTYESASKEVDTATDVLDLDNIREGVKPARFESPFGGYVDLLYADHTASGQPHSMIESFVSNEVLPWYGNTHSVSTASARATTFMRSEAREIIKNYFNLGSDYAVIFTGNGSTAAIAKFVSILDRTNCFDKSTTSDMMQFFELDRWGAYCCSLCSVRLKNEAAYRSHIFSALHTAKLPAAAAPSARKTIVLVDPWAHHSLLLPLREFASTHPLVSVKDLEISSLTLQLKENTEAGALSIVLLTAASNVTGESRNVHEISALVHAYSGIVCWDAAAVAAHYPLDVCPPANPHGYADFCFLSPHKLLGGPGASGVLLARKQWLFNSVPSEVGGGVVYFTSNSGHSYIQNPEEREEAGTPNILGNIRAGLAFKLHALIGTERIEKIEAGLHAHFRLAISADDRIRVLGNPGRAGIVSFNISINRDVLLHPLYVVAVLNDVFGIQARGGCACAGPFAQTLLGLDDAAVIEFEAALQRSGQDVFRPGFVRVGVHFTMTLDQVDFMANAILWVAQHGWRLLGAYTVDIITGEWKNRKSDFERERIWLSNIHVPINRDHPTFQCTPEMALAEAEKTLLNIITQPALDPRFAHLAWFALPADYKYSKKLGSIVFLVDPEIPRSPLGRAVKSSEADALPVAMAVADVRVPKKLRCTVVQAMSDFEMVKEGDRVLVGLSGGKDSLTLLYCLREIQRKCPFKFTIAAATVDPMTPEYQPHDLVEYMQSLGVQYHMLSEPIMELAKVHLDPKKQSICSFCSRMKRGLLYKCMRVNGYNVLALGQHLDDLAESFLMSAFRNGNLRTMKANYKVQKGDLRVIRPLVYVRERQTAEYAKQAQLPVIKDNCPACFAAPKERRRIKMLLSEEEFENSNVFSSLLQCMRPLISVRTALKPEDLLANEDMDEAEDYTAEEALQPCANGVCSIKR